MPAVRGRVISWTAPVVAGVLALTAALISIDSSHPHRTPTGLVNSTADTVSAPRRPSTTTTLVTTSTTTPTTTTTTSPVPVGETYDVPFAPILVGDISAARTCSVRDLRASDAGANGATGHSITYLDLTDISSTPCRLEGYPRVVAEVPGHSPVLVRDGGGFFTSMAIEPAVVSPGSAFELSIGTERDCPARYAQPGVYPTLPADGISIGVPGGSLFVADHLDVECGVTVSPYIQPAPEGPLPPPPPAFALQPEVASEPLEVPPDATFVFKIILSDLSGKPVSLSPCPWYTEITDTSPPTALSYLVKFRGGAHNPRARRLTRLVDGGGCALHRGTVPRPLDVGRPLSRRGSDDAGSARARRRRPLRRQVTGHAGAAHSTIDHR